MLEGLVLESQNFADISTGQIQPMINPLWGGLSEIDFFLSLLQEGEGAPKTALDEVKETAAAVGGDWNDVLRGREGSA